MEVNKIYLGDCVGVMKTFPDNCIDAICCDPPYELGFMGKSWDNTGIANSVEMWSECLRVLKPGGHLLAFSGTRTYHRMASAIEDAGFSIRDQIQWVYGCLDEKTEILTTEGFKTYQDIKKDEVVACFDIKSEEISYNKIKNLFIYDFDGEMINIKGRTTNQLLTPNHRVLLKEKKERGHRKNDFYETDWLFKEAKDITPNRGVKLPLAGNFNGSKSIGLEMAELLGWILTEGTINKRSGAIYICQTERYPKNVERIRYLLEKTDLFYTETKGTYPYKDRTYTRHDFYIPREKAEIIKKLIPNKKPTRELLGLKKEELLALFDGLIGGDGSFKQNSNETLGEFYQKDTDTLDWFQALCLHLGYKSSQNKKKGSVSWGKKSWMVIDAGWFKRKIKKVEYKGKVWCVEVPTGAFVARRNGQVFITGNSGFPKSLNIGKAVDKLQGNEREVVGKNPNYRPVSGKEGYLGQSNFRQTDGMSISTKGTSEWEGWGTALKPSHEPICMARKPLAEKTVAENCLKWGVGGINIDGCRVEAKDMEELEVARCNFEKNQTHKHTNTGQNFLASKELKATHNVGRFPANLIHDGSDEVVELFPNTKSGNLNSGHKRGDGTGNSFMGGGGTVHGNYGGDSGSAARFFYCAKASKSERNKGCEELEEKEEVYPGINTFDDKGNRLRADGSVIPPLKSKNNHPTVKPIALMEYLVKLVSKEGHLVLDPFAGSGSTLIACQNLRRNFIGIEREPDYIKIAEARLNTKQPTLL